jgi:hypothetical protein
MVCANSGLRLYANQGGAGFADVSSSVGLGAPITPTDAAFADVNGDGRLDVLFTTNGRITVLTQQSGMFVATSAYPIFLAKWIAVGDSNGDRAPDIYVSRGGARSGNPPDVMLLNDGTGTSFARMTVPQLTTGCGDPAYPIDYDRNGLTDYVVLNGCGPDPAGPLQLIAFAPALAGDGAWRPGRSA